MILNNGRELKRLNDGFLEWDLKRYDGPKSTPKAKEFSEVTDEELRKNCLEFGDEEKITILPVIK